MINQTHLSVLEAAADSKEWAGSTPTEWASWVCGSDGSVFVSRLPEGRINRKLLAAICNDMNTPTEVAFLAIMAWGGMNRRYGRTAWQNREQGLLEAMNDIRGKTSTAGALYSVFHSLSLNGRLPGIGPAYFTKLIFFLSPRSNAYIMDQWTAKSINLLFGSQIHLIVGPDRGRDTVSKKNSSKTYEQFCANVDALALKMGCNGAEAERRIFSQARPSPDHWRHYVKITWDPKLHNGSGQL